MANSISRDYVAYLESKEWKQKSATVRERDGWTCKNGLIWVRGTDIECDGPLQVHHLTYVRIFNESIADLITLCEAHHKLADRERKAEIRELQEQRGMETFARKRYGSQWRDVLDEYDVFQEFRWWVESRGAT